MLRTVLPFVIILYGVGLGSPSPAFGASCSQLTRAVRTWIADTWSSLRSPGAIDRKILRNLQSRGLTEEEQNLLISLSYVGVKPTDTYDEKEERSERFLVSGYRDRGADLHWRPTSPIERQRLNDAITGIASETEFAFLSKYLLERKNLLEFRLKTAEQAELSMLTRRIRLLEIAFEDYPPVSH